MRENGQSTQRAGKKPQEIKWDVFPVCIFKRKKSQIFQGGKKSFMVKNSQLPAPLTMKQKQAAEQQRSKTQNNKGQRRRPLFPHSQIKWIGIWNANIKHIYIYIYIYFNKFIYINIYLQQHNFQKYFVQIFSSCNSLALTKMTYNY
jgi:hypothetical protein